MVRSLNKVMLIGNLTRDPELRYTSKGTAVCNFGLATNRSWQTPDGQTEERAEFHRIVAWRKLAELCAQLLFKGRKAYVSGRVQTRSWNDSDGNERKTTEIVIRDMIVLDSKRQPSDSGTGKQPAEDQQDETQDKKEDSPASDDKEKKTKKKEKSKKKNPSSPAKRDSEEKEEVKADDIPF